MPELEELGRPYVLTEYGIWDDGKVYTKEIQKVIDLAAEEGGGVLVVPPGTYLTGALYFKQGVNLYVSAGATLKAAMISRIMIWPRPGSRERPACILRH